MTREDRAEAALDAYVEARVAEDPSYHNEEMRSLLLDLLMDLYHLAMAYEHDPYNLTNTALLCWREKG